MNATIAWSMPVACMARTAICNAAFDWKEVRVWSRSKATLGHFVKKQQPKCENFTIKTSTGIEKPFAGQMLL
jgi:alanine dehydrogenase